MRGMYRTRLYNNILYRVLFLYGRVRNKQCFRFVHKLLYRYDTGYDPYFYFLRAQNGTVRSSPFKRVARARYLDFINRFFLSPVRVRGMPL